MRWSNKWCPTLRSLRNENEKINAWLVAEKDEDEPSDLAESRWRLAVLIIPRWRTADRGWPPLSGDHHGTKPTVDVSPLTPGTPREDSTDGHSRRSVQPFGHDVHGCIAAWRGASPRSQRAMDRYQACHRRQTSLPRQAPGGILV